VLTHLRKYIHVHAVFHLRAPRHKRFEKTFIAKPDAVFISLSDVQKGICTSRVMRLFVCALRPSQIPITPRLGLPHLSHVRRE
jgi:hypothetical protein